MSVWAVGFCGLQHCCYRPYYPTARFRSPSSYMVSSRQVKAHVVLTCTNGVSPNRLPVIVASDSGAAAEIAQDLMHAGPTAANPQQRRRRANDGTCRQTDRRADTVPLRRPSCGYYASSVYSVDYDSMACSLTSSCPTRW